MSDRTARNLSNRAVMGAGQIIGAHLRKGSPIATGIGAILGLAAAIPLYFVLAKATSVENARRLIGPLGIVMTFAGACLGACIRREPSKESAPSARSQIGSNWSELRWMLTMTPVGALAGAAIGFLLTVFQPNAYERPVGNRKGAPIGHIMPAILGFAGCALGFVLGGTIYAKYHPEECLPQPEADAASPGPSRPKKKDKTKPTEITKANVEPKKRSAAETEKPPRLPVSKSGPVKDAKPMPKTKGPLAT